ncbi:MAG: CoA-transferase [Rhizobiaceae bacterium]
MSKIISAAEAAAQISDGATITLPGNASFMVVDCLLQALEERFRNEGSPKQLTAFVPCNAGLGPSTGVDRLAHKGLLKRYIASAFPIHKGSMLANMILNSEVEAYNFPMGVLYALLRESGARRPGLVTEVGMGTYVDPRQQGGKMNARTTEDLVEPISIGGKPYLFYKAPAIDVALLKATSSDDKGNLSLENEPLTLGSLALAIAAKANGGKVFAQVERLVEQHSRSPKTIVVPEHLVDGIVLAPDAPQSAASRFDARLTGEIRPPRRRDAAPDGPARLILLRAAAQLRRDWLVNLGVGLPTGLPSLLASLHLENELTITTEHGGINGDLEAPIFGAHVGADAILDPPSVFDMYDGGVLDATLLGLAQADAHGNVNVSKFGGRLMGCGGFINISGRAGTILFCTTLTAGGTDVAVENGRVIVRQEGRSRKFVETVEHQTFNGRQALERGQNVYIVTERGLFTLDREGWLLTEVAPGIVPGRDIAPVASFPLRVAENCRQYAPEILAGNAAGTRQWLAALLAGRG